MLVRLKEQQLLQPSSIKNSVDNNIRSVSAAATTEPRDVTPHCLHCGLMLIHEQTARDVDGAARNVTATRSSDDVTRGITWHRLALLLVRHVGSEQMIEMMRDVQLAGDVLPFSVYRYCVFDVIKRRQQR